ncbi:YwaF family protein [Pseudoneobacillus sp. C159]
MKLKPTMVILLAKYFSAEGNGAFVLFSSTHWLTLLTLALVNLIIFLFRQKLTVHHFNRLARLGLAVILIASEISLQWWIWWIDEWSIEYSLPLHLSSISLILSAVLLINKSYKLFEFTYFAGVGSALQAMLTPDISMYTFPHYRYTHFFISHGGIVVANLFMVFVEQYRPTWKSVCKAYVYLNIYAALIFVLNLMIGSNYMYISEKPINPSILDFLGPWPLYILPLEILAIVTFIILFIPFRLFTKKLV